MNSVYSAEPVAACLHQNTCLDSEQLGMSNGSLTLKQLFFRESGTGSLTKHPFLTISHLSSIKGTPETIRGWLMSLPQVSRVNRSQSQENNSQKTTHGISGRKLGIASASYDRNTRSWKTSQASCLNPISDEYSGIWPKSGMMLDGKLYPLKKQVIAIKEIDCGLWPTPTLCGNHNRKGLSKNSGDGLATAVKQFPTPTAQDFKRRGPNSKQQGLSNIDRFYPTPTNSMMTMQDMEQAKFAGNGNRPKYRDCFPTPCATEARQGIQNRLNKESRGTQKSLTTICQGNLNPDWVEWLMGWPIGWSDLKPLTKLERLDPSVDPHPDIPRTTDKTENRVNRIKAIGNGQVPLCASMAWEILNIWK